VVASGLRPEGRHRCFLPGFDPASPGARTARVPQRASHPRSEYAWHALVKARTIVFPSLLVFGVLFGLLAPGSFALDRSAADHSHSPARPVHSQQLIDQVQFNREVLSFEQGVTAGPGVGDLEIQFLAPQSVAPEHVHFRYRLLGLDSEWTETGKEREVVYNQLQPGRYMFQLEEAEGTNPWGQRSASLWIVVTPRYWQTASFWIMSAFGLLILTIVFFGLYVRSLTYTVHELREEVHQRTAETQLARKIAEDANRAAIEQSLRDSLTDLWNRRAIFEVLEKEISRAQRDQLPVAVVMIDLDHFKLVNDTYGHLTGDAVLQESAMRIAELMRPYDSAGRYGGEEFLIVLPGCSPSNGVRRAEDFRRAIAETPVLTASGPLTVTCSLGVASHDGVMAAEDLIHQADEALYCAKRLGRNCVRAAGVADTTSLTVTKPRSR